MVFAVNLKLRSGEDLSAITCVAEDAEQRIYPLTVEYIGQVSSFDWMTQVILKLPDELAKGGDLWVSISLHGANSNKAMIKLRP